MAFHSPIADILAVQTRQSRIHLEQDPDHPERVRVRNVPAIEAAGDIASRSPIHARMQANSVGRATSRKRRPDLLRAPAPGAELSILFTLVTLDVHGSGCTQNDPRADFASRAIAPRRWLHDRDEHECERRDRRG